MARITHEQILDLLTSFGYDINELGMCAGLSPMGLMALLAKELPAFDARINTLANHLEKMSAGDLASKINSIQEKRAAAVDVYKKELLTQLKINPQMTDNEFYKLLKDKRYKKNQHVTHYHYKCNNTDSILNPEELALNEVQAFLEGIVISFFSASKFPNLYKKKNRVSYQDLEISLKKIISHKLVKKPNLHRKSLLNYFKKKIKAGLKEKPLVKKAHQIIGLYTLPELKDFLFELKLLAIHSRHTLAFHLGSANHQITAGYDVEKRCWYLIDITNLPSRRYDLDLYLAHDIFSSFRVKEKLVLDTEIYCLKKAVKSVKKKFSKMTKKEEWKNLHDVEGKQNVVDDLDNSLLRAAARAGDTEALTSLLKCKNPAVDINEAVSGKTPLSLAAMFGRKKAVKLLLNNPYHRANPNIFYESDQLSPIGLAVENGNIKMVKSFLRTTHPTVNLERAGDMNYTPLHMAATKADIEIMELLIAAGANLNSQNTSGDTPLHLAIDEGQLAAVEVLLAKNANLDIMALDQNTSLLRAIKKRNKPIIKAILNSPTHVVDPLKKTIHGMSALMKAAEIGDVDILTALLTCRGIGNQTVDGSDLIYIAAKKGHTNFVMYLLNQDTIYFNKKKRSVAASSALYAAVRYKHQAVVETMLKLEDNTINPNIASEEGATPLFDAASNGELDLVNALFESKSSIKVEVDQATDAGETPLYIAVKNNHIETAKALLAHGANPNLIGNEKTYSPFIKAVRDRNTSMTQAFLECKDAQVNVNMVDANGYTPLFHATELGDNEIVKLLLNADNNNIDPYLVVKGYSALDLAAYNKDLTLFSTILHHPTFTRNPAAALACIKEAISTTANYGCVDILKAALRSELFTKDQAAAIEYINSLHTTAKQHGHRDVADEMNKFIRLHQKQPHKNHNTDKEDISLNNTRNKKLKIASSHEKATDKYHHSNASPLRNYSLFPDNATPEKPCHIEPLITPQSKRKSPKRVDDVIAQPTPSKRQRA